MYQPELGKITIDDELLTNISTKKSAQKMAVVSQDSATLFDFPVREVVLMGRAPHKKLMETDNNTDEKIMQEALQKVGMSSYENRSIATLSGGEKQRVMLARALAQQTHILVLDEPTNHLDIHHQLQLMDLVKTLDVTIIAALHDLNIAASYCDIIYVMKDGKMHTYGTPEEVITESLLEEVFRVHTSVKIHPITKKTHVTFLSSIS